MARGACVQTACVSSCLAAGRYRNGEGVPQDNGEALRWYRLALFLSRCGHRIFPCPRSYSSAHFESCSLLRFNPAAGSSPRLRGTAPNL